jgi:outer membrane protein assembly factor BamB
MRLAGRRPLRFPSGMTTRSRLLLGALWLASGLAASANWPQYRGPRASGLDDSAALPTKWNVETGENLRWKTDIPGLAHSSPIVWGDRVYVATAVNSAGRSDLKVGLYGNIEAAKDDAPHQWRLLALDKATGKIVWNVLGHEGVPKIPRHTKATHCNSTPATDGSRIVAIFGSEGLFCFDAKDGKLVWKKDLGPMDAGYFQMPTAQWGFASSPIIHEGKVIVQCDVQKGSFLAVFDLADGKEVWRTERKDVPTWSTPAVVQAAGRTQIAVNGWHHTGGYDFATGKELWKLDGGGDIPVPTPIAAGDLIYFTSAHGRSAPMRAIRADASGDITPDNSDWKHPSIAWNHDRRGNYMQTPILIGASIFACKDNALLTCFDARTGDVRFSERLSSNSAEGFTSSPVSDGRHVYFTSELGNVVVVPVAEKFSIAATNTLGETCLSTPAVSGGALFFRTRDKLVAIAAKR